MMMWITRLDNNFISTTLCSSNTSSMLSLNHSSKLFFWLNCVFLVLIYCLRRQSNHRPKLQHDKGRGLISVAASKWGGKGDGKLSGDLAQDDARHAQRHTCYLWRGIKCFFDQVEPAMNAMKVFDPTYGAKNYLTGAISKETMGLRISANTVRAKAMIDKTAVHSRLRPLRYARTAAI